jgi:hypothetical protein
LIDLHGEIILSYEESENYRAPAPEKVDGAPVPAPDRLEAYDFSVEAPTAPLLSGIQKTWNSACQSCEGNYPSSCCKGGMTYENNCAHFLSDALVRAGFVELLSDASLYKCDKADCGVSTQRRPIRAREMWVWFQNKAKVKKEKIRWNDIQKATGWWAVFQLDETKYFGGHVLVLDSDSWQYYGTCSYPAWDQYLYKW